MTRFEFVAVVLLIVALGALAFAFAGGAAAVQTLTALVAFVTTIANATNVFVAHRATHDSARPADDSARPADDSAPPADESAQTRRKRVYIVGAIGLVIMCSALFVACSLRGITRVPDVRDKPVGEAKELIDQSNLRVGHQRTRPAPAIIGHVTGQQPKAETKVDPDATVNLDVSAGVVVPRVVEEDLSDAMATIERAGLMVASTDRSFDDARKGTVFHQAPVAGEAVNPGSSLELKVSRGIRHNIVVNELRRCLRTADAQDAIGFGLRRLPNEACGFVRTGNAVAIAHCPVQWVCTWGASGRRPDVLVGDGRHQANVHDGTWRFAPAYPSRDKVRDGCRFVRAMRASIEAHYERLSGQPICR